MMFKEILSSVFIISGIFFYLVGVVGLLRLPDVFSRLHATTKCDTLGTGLIFIGLIILQGFSFISLNILVVLIFVWLTNPTAAHYISLVEYERKGVNQDGNT